MHDNQLPPSGSRVAQLLHQYLVQISPRAKHLMTHADKPMKINNEALRTSGAWVMESHLKLAQSKRLE